MSLQKLQEIVFEIQQKHNLTTTQIIEIADQIKDNINQNNTKNYNQNINQNNLNISRLILAKTGNLKETSCDPNEINSFIPLTLFSNRKLGVLETLVKFLIEELKLTYKQIAIMLNRDNRTIWCVYNKTQKKSSAPFPEAEGILIPINIFADRSNGTLETLVKYCKHKLNLRNSEIARLINRDDRTIWTEIRKGYKR